MTGVINNIGYTNTEGTRTAWQGSFSVNVSYVINDTCHAVLVPFGFSVSYIINDTCHAVLVPSVLVYPMS
jgi:hypothetical protein